MNGLFGLSSRLMERLTISGKLMVLGVVALGAVALPVVMLFKGVNVEDERNHAFIGIGAALLLLAYLLMGLRQTLLAAVERIDRGTRNMAKGDFSSVIAVQARDEFGALAQALNVMRKQLGERIERESLVAEENLRIRNGLDKTSANIMLADVDGKIVYCNEAVLQTLSVAESDIRRDLPNFRANAIVGANFDSFHRNPSHQRNLLGNLRGSHVTQIKVGPRFFRLRANPVSDQNGKRLGTVVEWLDRTDEIKSEEELSTLLTAAGEGDFTQRLAVAGKAGFFLQIAESMNRLMDVVQSGLTDVGSVINAIAKGDLTASIDNAYSGVFGQLKDDTNGTVERLREALGRIQESAHAVNVAAQEIAAGNSDLSSRTEEQASSLEQTASSMEQLNQTVKQNAENAGKANQLAEHSNRVAQEGGARVRQVVATMDIIQSSASKIAEIIGVIDSIAFQTNILALNAAVEAARAGEQGRGFAVVASEVRNLAQRSAQAAKEIKSLIVDSVDKVESGARQVREAGVTIEQMVSGLGELVHLVTDIATASKEQANGIEQVTTAVGHMDEVTQQNAALVEEAAAASESLEDQSRALTDAVSMFDLGMVQPTLVPPKRTKPARPAPRPARGGAPASVGGGEWSEF